MINGLISNFSNESDESTDFSINSPLRSLLNVRTGTRRLLHDIAYSSSEDSDSDDQTAEVHEKADKLTMEIMSKEIPIHSFNFPTLILDRERGLFRKQTEGRYLHHQKVFEKSFYGSLSSVERLELMEKLKRHTGCVNCLSFSKSGKTLLSGSDDLRVILWDWYNNKPLVEAYSKHKKNIFQTKFYDESNDQLKAISSSADGSISIHQFTNDGGHTEKQIYTHAGAVHKLAVSENVVYTCGEDAAVFEYDFRSKSQSKLLTLRERHRKIPLFSISSHPLECKFAVCGRDQFVRVYDRRNVRDVYSRHCPQDLLESRTTTRYISCCVYNYNGNELLASFNDESIYLFDANNHSVGSCLKKYQGHVNSATIKGVAFYGPQSEYIVTG
jgi:WD repeat-containing protein 42A